MDWACRCGRVFAWTGVVAWAFFFCLALIGETP